MTAGNFTFLFVVCLIACSAALRVNVADKVAKIDDSNVRMDGARQYGWGFETDDGEERDNRQDADSDARMGGRPVYGMRFQTGDGVIRDKQQAADSNVRMGGRPGYGMRFSFQTGDTRQAADSNVGMDRDAYGWDDDDYGWDAYDHAFITSDGNQSEPADEGIDLPPWMEIFYGYF